MSLQIHRAERADRLADALGEVLGDPLDDPFATEIVSVPTRGVERWLAQRLSHRLGTSTGRGDGSAPGSSFPSPRGWSPPPRRAADGSDPSAEPDPVAARARGLAAARQSSTRAAASRGPGCCGHISGTCPTTTPTERLDPVRSGRRWATARHLAELFARYAGSRPTMIRHWAEGRDLDGAGRPLPPDLAWQAELWRRLRAELDAPEPDRAARGRGRPAGRRPGRDRPAAAAVGVRRHPAGPGASDACSPRWPAPGGPPLAPARLPRPVARRRPVAHRPPRRARPRAERPHHRAAPAPAAGLPRPRLPRAAAHPAGTGP